MTPHFVTTEYTDYGAERDAKWDRRFLQLAKQVSTWSKDPSTQVGAVLVNSLRQVVGMGYNGFARGIADTDERLHDRETKYKLVVHAEINAILQAGQQARGATLYVYPSFMLPPICADCAKTAIQAGVATRPTRRIPVSSAGRTRSRWPRKCGTRRDCGA